MRSDMTGMSASPTIDSEGPTWRERREEQAWEDFLAYCRAQEIGPHE